MGERSYDAAMSDAAHLAAKAFHLAAAATLRELDRPSTQRAIAEILGEHAQGYGDCLHGRVGSLDRVRTWLERWSAAGLPELELLVTADAVEVRRRS